VKNIGRYGASHSGTIEWLLQRLSAIYLGLFAAYLLIRFSNGVFSDFTSWRGWFSHGPVRWAWIMFYGSLLLHAWIGMRSVFLDYIKPFTLRLVLTFGTAVLLIVCALWFVEVVYTGVVFEH